jgi:hypothetical protein
MPAPTHWPCALRVWPGGQGGGVVPMQRPSALRLVPGGQTGAQVPPTSSCPGGQVSGTHARPCSTVPGGQVCAAVRDPSPMARNAKARSTAATRRTWPIKHHSPKVPSRQNSCAQHGRWSEANAMRPESHRAGRRVDRTLVRESVLPAAQGVGQRVVRRLGTERRIEQERRGQLALLARTLPGRRGRRTGRAGFSPRSSTSARRRRAAAASPESRAGQAVGGVGFKRQRNRDVLAGLWAAGDSR